MRAIKGFRKIEFQMPIELHNQVKAIAEDSDYMAQGKAANMLLILGIQKYEGLKEAKAAADKNGAEPVDMEVGD